MLRGCLGLEGGESFLCHFEDMDIRSIDLGLLRIGQGVEGFAGEADFLFLLQAYFPDGVDGVKDVFPLRLRQRADGKSLFLAPIELAFRVADLLEPWGEEGRDTRFFLHGDDAHGLLVQGIDDELPKQQEAHGI